MKFRWQDELAAIKHSYGLSAAQESVAIAIHKRLLAERVFNERRNAYEESLEAKLRRLQVTESAAAHGYDHAVDGANANSGVHKRTLQMDRIAVPAHLQSEFTSTVNLFNSTFFAKFR